MAVLLVSAAVRQNRAVLIPQQSPLEHVVNSMKVPGCDSVRTGKSVAAASIETDRDTAARRFFYFVAREQSGQLSLLVMAVTVGSHDGDNLKV